MKKLFILLAIIFCIGFVNAAAYTNVTTYYPFNEASGNATDIVNSKNGLNISGVNRTAGKLNLAAEFNNNYFNVTDVSAGNLSSSPFSINFWMNSSVVTGNRNMFVKANATTGFYVIYMASTNRTSINDPTGTLIHSGTNSVFQSNWTMVTFTFANSNMSVYVNGIQTNNSIVPRNISTNLMAMSIGADVTQPNENYTGLIDDTSFWQRQLNSTEINELYNNGNGYSVGDGEFVQLISPTESSTTFNSIINFNASSFPFANGYSNVNATLNVWRSNGTLFATSTNAITGTNKNFTNWTISGIGFGSFKWNVLGCVNNATATQCSSAPSNFTFTSGLNTSTVFNATTYETSLESFNLNATINQTVSISSANLFYDGTSYSGTINGAGGSYLITKAIDIPSNYGNKTWYWNLLFSDGQQMNTTPQYQNVSTINLTFCGAAPQNIKYINFTFKNETIAQESVNASFATSWVYYLGSGTVTKSYSYINTSVNPSYAFCFNPPDKRVYSSLESTYSNSESQQRSYSPSSLSLTNVTTNTTLFLLPTSLGQYVTFQIINAAEQAIEGALVTVSSTTFGTVASALTDSSGGATFFLNPLSTYTVNVSASGFGSTSLTVTPSQTIYTIQLGSSGNVTQEDYTRGVSYTIRPSLSEVLNNNTAYNFNVTFVSTYWNLDSFGFTLRNSSGSILASTSGTGSSGGIVSTTLNTGNYTRIVINYFWVINNTYSNATAYWTVLDSSGTEWSINYFIQDLKSYIGTGLFGLDNFGLSIIIFLTIFVFTGIMSYKFGLNSPGAIMGIIFGLVLLFDVGLELIPNPVNAVDHFPTIFVLIIFIGVLIGEATK